MADSKLPTEGPVSATKPEVKLDAKTLKVSKPNPMWKYMGFGENFRPKLPSRNWMIFLTITGTFTGAVIYDKRETRRVQRKWCKLVEHIAKEPLDSKNMPRKLTVFLEGPPADGLRSAQDHFKEYVKPILVASGLDWEFIQGRKEGDIRADLAAKIRKSRLPAEQRNEDDPVSAIRSQSGIGEFQGPQGDIVIGRHTWKEYIRGVHEGWLGPLAGPANLAEESSLQVGTSTENEGDIFQTLEGTESPAAADSENSDASSLAEVPNSKPELSAKEEEKPKKAEKLAPFISIAEYRNATTPPELPIEFNPSQPISFPHILGFFNTPRRMYNFLNRRVLADSIGRETAAIILSGYRPYHTSSTSEAPTSFTADDVSNSPQASGAETSQVAEQQTVLTEEEREWHKSARVRVEGEPERTWLDPIVLDPRIASRMRRSELSAEDEERSKTIVVPEEEIEGWIKGGLRSLGRSGKDYFGFGEEKKKWPGEILNEEEE